MAIAYLHFKILSRKPKTEELPVGRTARRKAKGRTRSAKSACAAAAYYSGTAVEDEYFAKVYDYRRRRTVVHTEIMVPKDAPEWAWDRQRLWNAVEESHTRVDSRLALKVTAALPRELDRGEQIELIREYVQRVFVDRGMVADVSIHTARRNAEAENPHALILLTKKDIGPEGFGAVNRSWEVREFLVGARKAWEEVVNKHLDQAGHTERISMARLEKQAEAARARGDFDAAIALTRKPQTKQGPTVTDTRRNGTAWRYQNGEAFRRYEMRKSKSDSERYYQERRDELRREKAARDSKAKGATEEQ